MKKTLFYASKKAISILVVLILALSIVPIGVSATPASDIPTVMLDNFTLDALEYTGYKLQALKDAGLIYKSGGYGSSINSGYLSGINYDSDYNITGKETVSSPGTATGLAPNIAKFRSDGLCCASYVTYYLLNYLPNIKGIDTSLVASAISNTGMNSQAVITWVNAGNALVSAGKARRIDSVDQLQIGDVVIFRNGSDYPHTAIYAGEYSGRHFITHVGNSRGPEFSTIEGMAQAGDKSSYFEFAFSFPDIPHIQKNGTMEVYKKDQNGNSLSGAVFTVYDSKGSYVTTIGPTNSAGYANLPNDFLTYDTYTVVETTFPKNYTSNGQTSWTVTLNSSTPNGTVTVNAVNKLKDGYIVVNKKDAVDDRELSGAVFTVYNSSGAAVATVGPTNSAGNAKSEAIQFGNYTVRETTVPANYQQTTNQWAVTLSDDTVDASLTYTLRVPNNRQYGSVSVVKTAEDNFKENFTFRLQGMSVYGTPINMTAATNVSGVATFSNVEIGNNYTLSEINTPERYVIPPNQAAIVEWNKVTTKNFDNTLKKFRVTVNKIDSEFPYPQGDSKLEGAVYGLYNGGVLAASYTTDKNGRFTTDYFVCGDNWTIREITGSEGYMVDPTVHKVGAAALLYTVEYNNALDLTSYETVKNGRIQIIKHTDDGSTQIETPEAGAAFEVFLAKSGSYNATRPIERDILICDENGMATSKLLPYGVYRVHQISGWAGKEKVRDFLVFVSENGKIYPFIINNSSITSKIKVEKRNSEDGGLIAAAGIGFQIKKPDGSLLVQQIMYPTPTDISVFYTNEEGWLMLPQELDYGYGYQLIEVQTAPYFYLSDEPVPFDVTGETPIITVTKYNSPQKARIHITKNGEVFSSIASVDGMYRPQYAVRSLAGAGYEIFADEDIYLNNKLMVRKDTRVAAITTTVSGATSPLLYLGRYRVVEKTAPYGMAGTDEVKYITLSYRGQTVKEYTESVSFFNERQRVKISFEKAMEQDELFKIGSNGEIAAVRMGLYAESDIVAADGTKIPKDGLIEIVTVDTATGCGEFTVDLPVGSRIYLKEIATDNQYVLSNQKFPLEFSYAGQDIPLVKLTANGGKPIPNTIKRGKVAGMKVDEDGKELAGVLIGLFAPDTIEYTEKNALLTGISSGDGTFSFKDIPYGNWIVREITTPGAQYVLDETCYPVNITADKQIIKITITNIFVRGDVEGTKLDEDGNGLAGALIGLFNPEETEFTADNAVMTDVSTEDGSFSFTEVIFGDWLVREIATPSAAYVLNDTIYRVTISEDKEIINVEIENCFVRGSVRTTKVDEEYPDNKLTSAVFDVYADKNDNGEFDEDIDIFIGTLDEIETGIYQLNDLVYGGYFLRERTAPDKFLLDENTYYFEILMDGEIVEVENQAGVGFINQPKYGELWLTKKDASDGKLIPDCGIRIKDEFGNTVVEGRTDENGEVKFRLRAGKYTYQEFDAPAGYLLDESEYPFEITEHGQIIKAVMTNEKIPTPDIPKTGDDSNMALWIILMVVSAASIAGVTVADKRRKRQEDM
ncbi:MAG: hypothetical protein LBQ48_06445 [Oscillospiraceae bacterium]|nr:hypothetical protein [Oscillospiraceae bacterium]